MDYNHAKFYLEFYGEGEVYLAPPAPNYQTTP